MESAKKKESLKTKVVGGIGKFRAHWSKAGICCKGSLHGRYEAFEQKQIFLDYHHIQCI